MQQHYRTRQGQRVELTLRTGQRLSWHFQLERRTKIKFLEGTIRKRDLAAFVPLSMTKIRGVCSCLHSPN